MPGWSSPLRVILSDRLCIEIHKGFDPGTLEQVILSLRRTGAADNRPIVKDAAREYLPVATRTSVEGTVCFGILPDLIPVGNVSCVLSASAHDCEPAYQSVMWPQFRQAFSVFQHRGAAWAVPLSGNEFAGREPDETVAMNLVPIMADDVDTQAYRDRK